MARPDVQIEERVFRPREVSLGAIAKDALPSLLHLAGLVLWTSSINKGFWKRASDQLKLGVFYGHEAASAFEDAIRPKVRSTTQIQRDRQLWFFNRSNRVDSRPMIDYRAGHYTYRFDIRDNTQVLAPIFPG